MSIQNKGFTLIELLVVISVIGLLASVVLASLNSAREKAQDATIKQALAQFRRQAELSYLENNNYIDICEPDTQGGIIYRQAFSLSNSLGPGENNNCFQSNGHYWGSSSLSYATNSDAVDPNGSEWAAVVKLNSGNWFCVDSLGNTVESGTRGVGAGSPSDKTCG